MAIDWLLHMPGLTNAEIVSIKFSEKRYINNIYPLMALSKLFIVFQLMPGFHRIGLLP